jgi:uncharacterized tellurite resistance protein B-like protein
MLNKLSNFLSAMIPPNSDANRPELTLQLAVAVLLIEVMQSDAECAFDEQATILNILKQRFHLSDAEVAQLTERGQQTSKSAHDLLQFTSLIDHELELPEKVRIIEYLWQVVYADGKISAHENHLMRRLVDLLHISHGDNIAAKMRAKPDGFE